MQKKLLLISSKYLYFNPFFNYIRKGHWKGTLIHGNCDTLLCFRPQMFIYSNVSAEQKLLWLKIWNEFFVLWEVKKFPNLRFFYSQFDKRLHKATFQQLVFYFWMIIFFIFFQRCSFLFHCCYCSLRLRCSSFLMEYLWFFFVCEKIMDIIFFSSIIQ